MERWIIALGAVGLMACTAFAWVVAEVVVEICSNRRLGPVGRIAWMLVVACLPFAGACAWLLLEPRGLITVDDFERRLSTTIRKRPL